MILLMSEEKENNGKFFNLSPEEKHYYDLKVKENEEKTSLYNKIFKNTKAENELDK